MSIAGFVVIEPIRFAHPELHNYALLPDDLLVQHEDGSYMKECPGIAIGGFVLTPEQVATLRAVYFERHGLEYRITEEERE